MLHYIVMGIDCLGDVVSKIEATADSFTAIEQVFAEMEATPNVVRVVIDIAIPYTVEGQ